MRRSGGTDWANSNDLAAGSDASPLLGTDWQRYHRRIEGKWGADLGNAEGLTPQINEKTGR
jgi:hypothetical protein